VSGEDFWSGYRLNQLGAECERISQEHGFSTEVELGDVGKFCEKLLLIVSEVSEALEEFRDGRSLTDVYYNAANPDKPEGIPIELADALIRILSFCDANRIDIDAAVSLKMAYNKSRPHKHGRLF
jgi:hypothetical protein